LTEPLRHGGSIRSAEFSPDGRRVLIVSAGDDVLVWEVRTGQPSRSNCRIRAESTSPGSAQTANRLSRLARTRLPAFGILSLAN
jgi:WD40 repeat protein